MGTVICFVGAIGALIAILLIVIMCIAGKKAYAPLGLFAICVVVMLVSGLLPGDASSSSKTTTQKKSEISAEDEYISEETIAIDNENFVSAPFIIYSTAGEENGLSDTNMFVDGTIVSVFEKNGTDVCEAKTEEGTIFFHRIPLGTPKSEWEKLKEGELERVYFQYLGYSSVLDGPSGMLLKVEEKPENHDSVSETLYIEPIEEKEDTNFTEIDNFSYEISGDKVVLKRFVGDYSGDKTFLEIKPTYDIEGVSYKSDISSFQVGNKIETLILDEGIEEVAHAIFNGSDVKAVFFPKSMKIVYDDTLAYLNPDEGEKIKIFYAGTQEEWDNIFTEYKRTPVGEAEFGYDMGVAAADWVNEKIGHGYDSSLFQFYFSAGKSSLR